MSSDIGREREGGSDLSDELHVERSGDCELARDGAAYELDAAEGAFVEVLGRRDEAGVSRVHAGVLHVLRDGHAEHLTPARHRVYVYLLRRRGTGNGL